MDKPSAGTHALTDDHGVRRIWRVERLWALATALPVEEVPLASLAHYLDRDCWFGGRSVTTRSVAEHARKIYTCDLSYPIILNAQGGLMDGTHRLARAWIEGRPTIRAVRFPATPEPDETVPPEAPAPDPASRTEPSSGPLAL